MQKTTHQGDKETGWGGGDEVTHMRSYAISKTYVSNQLEEVFQLLQVEPVCHDLGEELEDVGDSSIALGLLSLPEGGDVVHGDPVAQATKEFAQGSHVGHIIQVG